MSFERVIEAADYIRGQLKGRTIPRIAIVLGSGLNDMAEEITDAVIIPYGDIPNYPTPTVLGHAGRLLIGNLGETPVICQQGRVHAYEGHSGDKVAFATRLMWALDVDILVLTNAAGSLDFPIRPGGLMAITDHINMSGFNPLVGDNEPRYGARNPDDHGQRFTGLTRAWDKELTAQLTASAAAVSVPMHHGTYAMMMGPTFETPAEIRMLQRIGASAVGMSTVPECVVARHCGLRVCGVSSMTNMGAGMEDVELSHDADAMTYGKVAGEKLGAVLKHFVARV